MAFRKFGRGTLKLLFVFVIIVMLVAVAINENIVTSSSGGLSTDSPYFTEELKRMSPQVHDLPIPSTISAPILPQITDSVSMRVPGIEKYL